MIWAAVILAITLFALYSASAWVMLRSVGNARLGPFAWALALGAIFAHTDAIVRKMTSFGPYSIGLFEAMSILAWTLAIVACFIAVEKQNRALAAILLFLAAFGAALLGIGHPYAEETAPSWELTAHILLSMGAAALLLGAAVTGLVWVFLNRRLRTRRLIDLPTSLPPLDSLEKVMFRLIGAGFVLLTLALLTGFIFVTNLWAQHLQHKTILSCIAWLLFAVLLFGRIRYGWRGRPAVTWTLCGFGFLGLSYFGSKFVLEYLLHRHWG
jgi:ABC-type uncharacterized transport system permease subunit